MDTQIDNGNENSGFEMVVLDKNGEESRHDLKEGTECTIGSPECDIKINDEYLLNNFSIVVKKGSVKAKSLSSSHGIQFLTNKEVKVSPNELVFKGKSYLLYFQKKGD